jgi:hypothetical protein
VLLIPEIAFILDIKLLKASKDGASAKATMSYLPNTK